MIRLLIADDQLSFRQSLADLLSLQPDLEIVGQASHGQDAIALVKTLQPDVILMDVQMPICDGATATREIHRAFPWIRILVLTTFDDDEYIEQCLQAGAVGYLLKNTPARQLSAAIHAVYEGYSQLGPTITTKVFAQVRLSSSESASNYQFSDRELEVLQRLAQGESNRAIARTLYITEGTVKNHISRILSELGVHSRTQAALWAQNHL